MLQLHKEFKFKFHLQIFELALEFIDDYVQILNVLPCIILESASAISMGNIGSNIPKVWDNLNSADMILHSVISNQEILGLWPCPWDYQTFYWSWIVCHSIKKPIFFARFPICGPPRLQVSHIFLLLFILTALNLKEKSSLKNS